MRGVALLELRERVWSWERLAVLLTRELREGRLRSLGSGVTLLHVGEIRRSFFRTRSLRRDYGSDLITRLL